MLERIIYEQETLTVGRIEFCVVGIKPLLTHNPESMGASSGAKRGSRVPEAEDEAEAGVYRLADGSCGIKGEAFRAAIVKAAAAWKSKRSSMKSQLTHITTIEELVMLRHP